MKNLVFLLFIPLISYTQETLNNQSVIDMIEIGFEEQVIIDKIELTNSDFDTSIDSLKSLKESGLSPSLLSAMIKASKKETQVIVIKEKKASPPKPNDTEFYWEDGRGDIVKVIFMLEVGRDFTIDESELARFTNMIMTQAKMELKAPSSFRPTFLLLRERVKTDKYLTKKDNTKFVIQLSSSGTNAYGGIVDGINIMGVNPNLIPLEKSEELIAQESTAKDYVCKKAYYDGESFKMNVKISILKDFLLMTIDGYEYPRMPIDNKQFITDNHWKAVTNDYVIEYNGNETKYKTDGGILIFSGEGIEQVYPLIKSN